MKSVLIITGPENEYGSGHAMRMHALALELKRHGVTVLKTVLRERDEVTLPLDFSAAILDRRDTAFPDFVHKTTAVRIALDNRGAGRSQAHLVHDALPHFAMNDAEYRSALAALILPAHITTLPCRSSEARVTLHDSQASALLAADFPQAPERLSPRQFAAALLQAKRVACYFGQTLFEACYLGKQVALYSVSDYHRKLAEDFVRRIAREPQLLGALSGGGLEKLRRLVLQALRGK